MATLDDYMKRITGRDNKKKEEEQKLRFNKTSDTSIQKRLKDYASVVGKAYDDEQKYISSLSPVDQSAYKRVKASNYVYSSPYLKKGREGKSDLEYGDTSWNQLSKEEKERWFDTVEKNPNANYNDKDIPWQARYAYDIMNASQTTKVGAFGANKKKMFDLQTEQKWMWNSLPAKVRNGIRTGDKEAMDYLKKNYSSDEISMFQKYAELMSDVEDVESIKEMQSDLMESNPVYAVGIAPIQQIGADIGAAMVSAPRTLWNLASERGNYDVVNPYDSFLQKAAEAGRGVQQEILEGLDDRKLMQAYYGASVSTAESALRLGLAHGAATVLTKIPALSSLPYDKVAGIAMNGLMFPSVVQQSAVEMQQKGVPASQALAKAISAGIFECLFETISFDKLGFFNETPVVGSVKTFAKNLLKSGFVEGSEEVATDIANEIYDYFAMYDYSDFKAFKDKLEADSGEPISDKEAWKLYGSEFADKLTESFLGGAFSGMTMGGTTNARGIANYRAYESMGANVNDATAARMTPVINDLMSNPNIAARMELVSDSETARRGMMQEIFNNMERMYGSRIEKATEKSLPVIMQNINTSLNGVISEDLINKYNAKMIEFGKGDEQVDYAKYRQNMEKGNQTTFDDMAYGEGDASVLQEYEKANKEYRDAMFDGSLDAQYRVEAMNKAEEQMEQSRQAAIEIVENAAARGESLDSPALRKYVSVLGIEDSARAYSAAKVAGENVSVKAKKGSVSSISREEASAVFGDNAGDIEEVTYQNIEHNPDFKEGLYFGQIVAKMTGADVKLYKSTRQNIQNGAYRNGTIYIDVNAGHSGEAAALGEVFSHELTHWMRDNNEAGYQNLLEFVRSRAGGAFDSLVNRKIKQMKEIAEKTGHPEMELDENGAQEEVIAEACQKMLYSSETFMEYAKADLQGAKNFVERFKDFLKRVRNAFRGSLHSDPTDVIGKLEGLAAEWEKALQGAISNADGIAVREAMEGKENITKSIERNADGDMTVAEMDDGTLMYSERTYFNGGKQAIEAQLRKQGFSAEDIAKTTDRIEKHLAYIHEIAEQYATQNFPNLLKNLGTDITTDLATEAEILDMMEKDGSVSQEVINNLRSQHQVAYAYVSNGDYAMNIDLQLSCKKRIAYEMVINELVKSGAMADVRMSGELIGKINMILAANEFETQCLGCFVESRRLQMQKWAETIVEEWNQQVERITGKKRDKATKKKSYLFHGETAVTAIDAYQAHLFLENSINSGERGRADNGGIKLKSDSVYDKMGELISFNPKLYGKFISVDDVLTADGLMNIRKIDNGNMFSLVKQRYGAASPKILQSFNPYNSEILNLTFKSVKEMTGNGVTGNQKYTSAARKALTAEDKAVIEKVAYEQFGAGEMNAKDRKALIKRLTDERVETDAIRQYLLDVGGNRIQSFSDFMIENVFDMLQIFNDFAIRNFSVHGYTKEQMCLRLFGMTGAKWNGSWISHNLKEMGKERAGLMPYTEENAKNGITVEVDGEKYVIQFDDYARHVRERSFIQSIGFRDAIAIMLDPRYSDNVGTITIGFSDKHIRAMLNNPYFRMVIPYHASGMIPGFADLVGASTYNDYTNYQNTTLGTVKVYKDGKLVGEYKHSDVAGQGVYKDKKGLFVAHNGKSYKINPDMSFNFNEALQRLGDAKAAADEYVAWCRSEHDIRSTTKGKNAVNYDGLVIVAEFNPKFSDSPMGYDFTHEQNYYKLLEDFNVYNSREEIINGVSVNARQNGVQSLFPGDEGGTLSAEQLAQYRADLKQTGLFSEKDIEKYVKKAQMTFDELIGEEVAGRNAYYENVFGKNNEKFDKALGEIKEAMKDFQRLDDIANSKEEHLDNPDMKPTAGTYMGKQRNSTRDSEVFGQDWKPLPKEYQDFLRGSDATVYGDGKAITYDGSNHLYRLVFATDNTYYGRQVYYLRTVNPWVASEHSDEFVGKKMAELNNLAERIKSDGYDSIVMDMYGEIPGLNNERIMHDDVYLFDDSNRMEVPQIKEEEEEETPQEKVVTKNTDNKGNKLSAAQKKYFANSKVRDENGNLKVMYHGSDSAGFTVFNAEFSDDGISLFFTDDNTVAKTYSSTYENFAPKKMSVKDLNELMAEYGNDGVKLRKVGTGFELNDNGKTKTFDSLDAADDYIRLYYVDSIEMANYAVYLNITNPMVVDAKGSGWSYITPDNAIEVEMKYEDGEWTVTHNGEVVEVDDPWNYGDTIGDTDLQEELDELADSDEDSATFSTVLDETGSYAIEYETTRTLAAKAHEEGYDGVIINNVLDTSIYGTAEESMRTSTVAIAFNSNQIKSINNTNPTENDDIRYSTRDSESLDRDYFAAVESGNKTEQRKIVEEFARRAGYNSPILYHGSEEFGFTRFDLGRSDDNISIFLSDSEETAASYSGGEARPISNEELGDPRTMSAEELVDFYNSYDVFSGTAKLFGDDDYNKVISNADKEVKDALSAFDMMKEWEWDGEHGFNILKNPKLNKEIFEKVMRNVNNIKQEFDRYERSKNDRRKLNMMRRVIAANETEIRNLLNDHLLARVFLPDTLDGYALSRLEKVLMYKERGEDFIESRGGYMQSIEDFREDIINTIESEGVGSTYRLYAKTENPFTISAHESYWDSIRPKKSIRDEMIAMGIIEDGTYYCKTRDLARYAKEKGYDSLIIKDVVDMGQYQTGEEDISNVYVVFSPEQVKSADLVTRDDEGNIIPPSERFTTESDDIRYSYRDLANSESEILINALKNDAALVDELGAKQSIEAYAREYNRLKEMENQQIEITKQLRKKDTSPSEREVLLKKMVRLDRAILNKTTELTEMRNQRVIRDLLISEWDKRDTLVAAGRAEERYLTRKALEEKYGKELSALKEKTRQQKQEIRDRHTINERKANIIKKTKQLMDMCLHPTEKKKVPTVLINPVVELLDAIDYWTPAEGRRVTKKSESLRERFVNFREAINEYQEQINEGTEQIEYMFDPEFLETVDELAKSVKGINNVNDMNAEEITALDQTLTQLYHLISRGNKMITASHYQTVNEYTDKTRQAMEKRKTLSEKTSAKGSWLSRLNAGMADTYAFGEYAGEGTREIVDMLSKAFEDKEFHVKEAIEFTQEVLKPYKKELKKWSQDEHEFTLSTTDKDGNPNKVKLTVGQMMELYLLNKREQARGHIYGGGIRVENRKGKFTESVKITESDVAEIMDYLKSVPGAMEVADKLQQYGATTITGWGNQASNLMYGISKFTDENYWQIRSDSSALKDNENTEKALNASMYRLQNMGRTKAVKKGANNAIYIGDVFDTWSKTIDEMTSYASILPATTDAMRWWNSRVELDGENTVRVKKLLESKLGTDMTRVFTDTIKALNGGIMGTDSLESLVKKLTGKAKAAAVAGNLRVVLQQPTAYTRAAAVIEPKYLLKALTMKPNAKEAQEHSAIAWHKAQGFYSNGLAPSLRKMVIGDASIGESLTEKSLWLAGKADDITWGALWNASKLKVEAENKALKIGSDAYWNEVNKVFSNIINQTQVVDTPLTKSTWMRGNGLGVYFTAFMAEPTKTYSMVMERLDRVLQNPTSKDAWKAFAGVGAVFAVNAMVNAMAQALADAARDDDKEKDYWEKYIEQYNKDVKDNINPITYIPVVKDIWSLSQGYSNSNLSMQAAQNTVYAVNELKKIANGTSKKTLFGQAETVAKAISGWTGIPVGNVMRTLNSIGNVAGVDIFRRKKYTNSELGRNVVLSMNEGDTSAADQYMAELLENCKGDTNKANNYVITYLADHDNEIDAWAERYMEDATTINDAIDAMSDKYSAEIVTKAIRKSVNNDADEDDKIKTSTLAESQYTSDDINRMLEKGKVTEAQDIIDEINAKYKEMGSKTTAKNAVTAYWKPKYLAASGAERDKILKMLYKLKNNGQQMYSSKDIAKWK